MPHHFTRNLARAEGHKNDEDKKNDEDLFYAKNTGNRLLAKTDR